MVIVSLPPLLHQYGTVLCLLRVSARLIGGGSGSGRCQKRFTANVSGKRDKGEELGVNKSSLVPARKYLELRVHKQSW